MTRDLILMHEDTPVLQADVSMGRYTVLDNTHMPYGLRGKLRKVPGFSEVKSESDDRRRQELIRLNNEAMDFWFADRTLLLSRANAKKIYNALGMPQKEDKKSRAKVAITCRAVSILDHFWVKLNGSRITWDKVDLTRNPLNEVIAQIALHGKSLTVQGSLTTPELTTNGAYAKAWRRHSDGSLWLYKLGHKGSWESKVEVMVSALLDKMNVNHARYIAGEDEGQFVCMCKNIATNGLSILPGGDFISYCNVNGLNWMRELQKIDSDGMYKMWIVDYLISNPDRHGQNWGLYYDNGTFDFVSMHPLFDHNNAFDIDWMANPESEYIFTGKTMQQSARQAMKHVDFHFTAPITRNDFLTDRQWESFRWRAKDLGLM